MKVRLLPSSIGEPSNCQYLTSFLVDERIAIDAGSLGFGATHAEQRAVKHLFLSHSHLDHLASLPTFLENIYTGTDDCVQVYASDAVLDTLQRDMFNDRIWPDFIRLSREMPPFLRLHRLEARVPVEVEGVTITPIPVTHIVPTFGFLLEDAGAGIAIVSDTGPTEEFWAAAGKLPGLRAVFLDASFPNEEVKLANCSEHLTPTMFAAEAAKLTVDVEWYAVHVKAVFREAVARELKALGLPRLTIADPESTYEF